MILRSAAGGRTAGATWRSERKLEHKGGAAAMNRRIATGGQTLERKKPRRGTAGEAT
jgi:hypothetical protein